MKNAISLLVAGAACLALGSSALAETYRLTTYAPPNEAASTANTWIAEEIARKTNGEITFEIFYASTLVPAKEQMRAVGDGVAHVGFQPASYIPSDLPLNNALTPYGFLETNPTAMGMAFADWSMHDAAALEQYTKANVVPFGGFSTPTYPAICNTSKPITSLAQWKGLKVRFPGGANAKLTQDLGGVAVNIPGNELYQALQTGSIDCAGILAGFLNIDNSLQEVSKSVTLLDFSGSFNSPIQVYNRDFWKSLTDDQRKIIMEATARGSARMQIKFNTDNQKALDTAQAAGHSIVEPDAEFKAAVKAWVDNGVGDMAGIARATYGVQDPEALFASIDPYVKKWHDLINAMADVNDEDALTKVILDNMYNDLDPARYGMD